MARYRRQRRTRGRRERKVPPSRRNRKNRKFYNEPLGKKKGYIRVCATYYYWKRSR